MPGSISPHEQISTQPAVLQRGTRLKGLWVPLAIYAATRLIDGALFAWGSRFQIATSRVAGSDPNSGHYVYQAERADPGYLGIATNWDGQWFQLIASEGYQPASIDSGPVATRAWAFPPLYPKVVGWTMRATHWEFGLAAVSVSLLFGAIAMVLIFRLARPHVGDLGAAGLVALTCMFVSAPLLQVAYSESMGLALLAGVLLMLRRGSYWWATLGAIALSFTRLITPPLAIVAAACWLYRRRTQQHEVSAPQMTGLVTFIAVAVTGPFYWTGLSTILRGTSEGDRALALTTGYSAGYFGAFFSVTPVAALLPVAVAVLIIRIAWSERHNWGIELSSWAAAYPVFILAVTPPTTGLIRYLLLAFPFGLALVGNHNSSTRRRITMIIVACAILFLMQAAWVRFSFLLAPTAGLPTLMP